MSTPEMAIVIVNFNSGGHLDGCLEALSAHAPSWPVEMIVVDNASSDGSHLAARRAGIRLHETGCNAGFGAGCNQGWRLTAAPRILFLNPDAQVVAGTLAGARAALDARSRVGIVGLALEDRAGRALPGWGREPTWWTEAWQKLVWNRPHWAARRYARARAVDWVSGAALLCRREVLERLGGFDEGYFLYFEDIDFCRRAREAGWGIWYEAGARVVHAGGGCGGLDPAARRLHLCAGRRRYREKFAKLEA